MAKIKINGDSSGYVEIAAPNAAHNNTLELGPGTKILTDKNTHTGNIGIGTDNPVERLHVSKNSATGPSIYITNDSTGHTSSDGLQLGFDGSNNVEFRNRENTQILLYTNNTERLRIDSGGNVNIKGGNLSVGLDSATLDFTDSNSNTKFVEIGASGGDALLVTHSSGAGVGYFGYEAGGDRLVVACDNGSGANKIDFIVNATTFTGGSTDNLNNVSPALRITADGDVGIGTDIPTSDLHVFRSTSTSSIVDAAAGNALLTLRNAGNGNWSGINFTRERSTGTNVTGGSIWMPSDTSNNSATLYLQTQSASANAGASGALTDNNGVRLKLASQPGGNGGNSAFTVEVGSAERFRVSSEGYVTKTSQPGFYARRTTSGDGRAAGVMTEWHISGTGSYNEGSHFKTTGSDAGRFVAPVTGKYYFAAQPGYKQTGQNFNFYFRIDGVEVSEPVRIIDGGDDLTSHSAFTGTCIVHMTAGQKFDVYIGSTHHVNTTYCFFCGYLMG